MHQKMQSAFFSMTPQPTLNVGKC